MAYQQGQEQPKYYVLGNKLNAIRDQLSEQFTDLAQNMEQQMADLRQQIAAEKQLSAQIRQQLKESDAQRDQMINECTKKTGDLNKINGFYSNKADANAFNALLNEIVQRHQSFDAALAQNNYDQQTSAMNKEWQDEIYKITQFIQNSANQNEFAAIVDELTKRTNELQTIKGIEDGNVPCQAMIDLVAQCEQRHNAQSNGQIEDANVLQDNVQWQGLMNNLKDFILSNQAELEQRNAYYLQELEGRIDDLSNFKQILAVEIDEEKQDLSKLRKKDRQQIKAKKVNTAIRSTQQLNAATKERHVEIEENVKQTMNLQKEKDQQEFSSLGHNDEAWRKEFDEDTAALIEFLV